MDNRVVMAVVGSQLISAQAFAQQPPVTGKVANAPGARLAGAIVIKGTSPGTPSTNEGIHSIRVDPGEGSSQPLFILDGLPVDNQTMNTACQASDLSSNTAFDHPGVDFINPAADFDSEALAEHHGAGGAGT